MPRVLPSQVVAFIDRHFPGIASNPGSTSTLPGPFLAPLVRSVEAIPPELMVIEGDDYIDLLSAFSIIQDALTFQNQRGHSTQLVQIKGNNPVAVIRNALLKCPDQGVLAATSDLNFINDVDLRESIRLDIGSANQDFVNGEWKGATVLAGSAIEALLLWSVQETERKTPGTLDPANDPERWDLFELIEVAVRLGLIKGSPTGVAAKSCKDFRNLIHPGRVQRTKMKCSRATAHGALAAVEHVIEDLS